MTNDKTIEVNKLIAEFMEATKSKVDNDSRYLRFKEKHAGTDSYAFYPKDLKYHSSWDWLMPVWGKCIEIIGLWAHTHEKDSYSKLWLEASERIKTAMLSVDISKAFSEIAQLIQWYNTQKQ